MVIAGFLLIGLPIALATPTSREEIEALRTGAERMLTEGIPSVISFLSGLPFVGMDCVEVAPPYDHAELSSYAAARFVWTYLCGCIARGAHAGA